MQNRAWRQNLGVHVERSRFVSRAGLTALIVGLVGCAAPTPKPPSLDYVAPARCTNDRQCQAMWAAAPGAISRLTGMKIRLQTDSYIETYDGTRQGRLYGRVSYGPHNDGGYVIAPYIECGVYTCDGVARDAETLFNHAMNETGLPYADKPADNSPSKSNGVESQK